MIRSVIDGNNYDDNKKTTLNTERIFGCLDQSIALIDKHTGCDCFHPANVCECPSPPTNGYEVLQPMKMGHEASVNKNISPLTSAEINGDIPPTQFRR